jgi:glycosyltransferase involved in cell wall biosynthesis
MKKLLFITDIPRPYRINLLNELSKQQNVDLVVIYLGYKVDNLEWERLEMNHRHIFLGKRGPVKGVLKIIASFKPEFIITGFFRLPVIVAILYSYIKRIKHVIYTDAWEYQEKDYSFLHILVRKIFYKHAFHFFPVSQKGKENIIKNYKVSVSKVSVVPYTIPLEKYKTKAFDKREYDLMFAGQFIDRKQPLFFCKVAHALQLNLQREINLLLLGTGQLLKETTEYLEKNGIKYYSPGFVQGDDLPQYYANSRFFLFPSLSDGWGVVAHEAIASGTIVFTTPYTGVADELIISGYNGFVLPLNEILWVQKVAELLENEDYYDLLSKNARIHSQRFNVQEADKIVLEVLQ